MAKLLIFRGDTKLDERELTEHTVRIGRAPQNDLILEDPGKGVSRNHAEIRFKDGRYTLIDLGSQNGIWVSGTRVPSVVLEPGVSVALGPYRLQVEAPVAVAPAVAVAPISGIDTAPTELTQLSERAAPLALDSLGPAPAKKESTAAPAVEKRSVPVVKEPTRKERTVRDSKVAKPEPSRPLNARLVGAIAALVLVVAVAVVAYQVFRKSPERPWDSTVAQALIASGKCQEALDTQINPALQANPNNQQALSLRDECHRTLAQVTSVATSSIPAAPTADDRLNEAEPLLQASVAADCQRALDIINAVLVEDANNERAKELSVKANSCINPPRGTTQVASAEKLAVPVAPPQGGLEVIQGETDKAYKTRIANARKKYDEAVAVLGTQKYSQALAMFNELMNEVPSGYLDLQQRRDEARAGMRAEGKAALDAAQLADGRDNFDTAIEQYRRAHQLDPSIQVDAAVKGVMERKLTLGRKRCNEGRVAFSFGDTAAALPALQEAVKLLQGTNDPCYATAREYLQKLK